MTRIVPIALTACSLLCVGVLSSAQAESERVRRFALVVGANHGGTDRVTLRYAGTDAENFARVLQDLGGVDRSDVVLLRDPDRAAFDRSFDVMRERIARTASASTRSELLIYYSGHSDEDGLLMHGERYSYAALRERIKRMPSDVNIAVLDSCASGALTRRKGGKKRPPFLVDRSLQVKGYAFLTSSSADEVAQESDRIAASYFTHYLVSGLRGGADANRDDRVTLNEAYQFAFNETVARTETTQAGAQHPAYDIHLVGTGDLVMTDLRATDATLEFSADVAGRLFVNDARGRLVIELAKEAGQPTVIGLADGTYDITLQRGAQRLRARVQPRRGTRTPVARAQFLAVVTEPTTARGGPAQAAPAPLPIAEPAAPPVPRTTIPISFQLVPMSGVRENSVNYLQLNALVGQGAHLSGIELGSLVNIREGHVGGIQAAGIANVTSGDVLAIQAAGIANVAEGRVSGAQLAGIVNVNEGGTSALQAAGIANVTEGRFFGVQAAGIANVAEGRVRGIQAAGIANVAGGSGAGIQLGGIANVNEGSYRGIQLGGIANVNEGSYRGVQVAGIANVNENDFHGVQVALVNVGGVIHGAQVGLINVAQRVNGFQLGLVNVSDDGGAPIGFVSYQGKGRFDIEAWTSDLTPLSVGLKLGGKRVYGVLGAASDNVRYLFGWGLGVHTRYSWFYLDVDALGYTVTDHSLGDTDNDALGSLRVAMGVPLTGGFSVFGGLALNGTMAFAGKEGAKMSFMDGAVVESGDAVVRITPGFFAGISY